MKKILTLLGEVVLVGLSLVGPTGVSLVGPANSSIEEVRVESSHRHTVEACTVYIESKKESYCRIIEIKEG